MRERLSSILVVLSFTCLVFVSACNQVGSLSTSANTNTNSSQPQPSAPQSPAGPPAPVPAVLTDCGTIISTPGTYSLNSGLTTTSTDEPCVTIADTHNVTLNCNGNSISGAGEGISVLNVSGLAIENCTVATGAGNAVSAALSLTNVNGGTVTGSTFGVKQSNLGGVWISDSTNVTFGGQILSAPANPSVTVTTNPSVSSQISAAPPPINTVYGDVSASNSINVTIEGNAITSGSTTFPRSFGIGIFGNQNTQVVKNTVNGLGSPLLIEVNGQYYYDGVGTDDDIVIEDEMGPGSQISGNLLVNTFDCGIETAGFMKDVTISDNYIDTVATGIGGWYYLNVTNVQYLRNTLTNIQYAGFYYIRRGPLRPAGAQSLPDIFYPIPADMPAETTINFTQNQFSGNTLSQPILFQGKWQGASVFALVYSAMGYSASNLPGTDPALQQFVTVNNTFINNTFDKVFGPLALSGGQPWTYTSDDVIDGGGNICASQQIQLPSVSPTFGQTNSYSLVTPIDCGSGN
jgi:hypothetical protein